jgi:uncharacterized protein (DUF58 family)
MDEPHAGPDVWPGRWLHWVYFQSAGLNHFIQRRLRPAGISLGIVLVTATCLGIGHARSAIYQLFSLCVAFGAIGLSWVLVRRARLAAVREVPRYATAGVPLQIAVKVTNRGRFTVRRAWLVESVPDPRPHWQDFTTLREPGEEERNRFDRAFAYFRWQWLMRRNRLFTGGGSQDEIHLKPGASAQVFIRLTPLRRGVVRLHDMRAALPDPLGFFQKCVKVESAPAGMIILPRRYPLPPVSMPGMAAFKISGESNTNTIGNSGEFVGLRDYRPGDPLRQIHWKSWAKAGRPIVKELEDTHYPRFGLALDTLSNGRDDTTFEQAVSVAASFAAAIDTHESLLDLMFVKDQAHIVTAGRGIERAEKLLEVLAGVAPARSGDHRALAGLVLRHSADLSSCLVILNGWDDSRADLLRRLEQGGVVCVPVIIGRGPRPDDVPGHWLESANIARDLMRLPQHL